MGTVTSIYISIARGSPSAVPSSDKMTSPDAKREARDLYVLIKIGVLQMLL